MAEIGSDTIFCITKPCLFLVAEGQHIDHIDGWLNAVQGDIAGIAKRYYQFAQLRRVWQRSPYVGAVSNSKSCRSMACPARLDACGFLFAKNRRHRSKPCPAPSVTITRGTWATLFPPQYPRCTTRLAPLARLDDGQFPDTLSRMQMPLV